MSKLFKEALVTMIVLFGVVAAVCSFVAAWIIYTNLTSSSQNKGIAIASGIAAVSPEIFLNLDAATVQSIIDQYIEIENVSYVLVKTAKNEVLAHTFVPAIPKWFPVVEAKNHSEKENQKDYLVQRVNDILDISSPILNGVAGRVHVGIDLAHVTKAIWGAIMQVQLVTFGAFSVSVFVAYLLMNQLSRPLAQLTQYAAKLGARDFSTPLKIKRGGEIGLLADTMNSMASELNQHLQKLQMAMDAVAKSERRYRELFNSISDLIYTLDLDGRFISANQAVGKALGYTPQEMVGIYLDSLVDASERKQFKVNALLNLSAAEPRQGLQTFTAKDGTKIVLEYRHILVEKPDQEAFVSGSGSDVTKRVMAQKALQESEERFWGLFEHSPIALMELDLSALKEYLGKMHSTESSDIFNQIRDNPSETLLILTTLVEVLSINKAFVVLFDARQKKSLLRKLPELLSKRPEVIFRSLIELAQGASSFESEAVLHTLSGVDKQVMLGLNVLPGHETTLSRVLVSMIDITVRKKAEIELIRRQEQLRALSAELMRTEEREKRRIASDLHDGVGQYLLAAKLKVRAFQKKNTGFNDRALSEAVEFIQKAVADTRTLTAQLSPPVLHEIGLEAALVWLAEQCSDYFGIQVTCHEDELPVSLSEDIKILLYRSVSELVLNAAKHSGADHVVINYGKNDGQIFLTVRDNGQGFSGEAQLGQDHGKFGLFSIRERLDLLGGSLDIVTRRNEGSIITLALPIPPGNAGLL